jgi:hypothetical protein
MAVRIWTNTGLARVYGAVCSAICLTEACIPSPVVVAFHVFIEAS